MNRKAARTITKRNGKAEELHARELRTSVNRPSSGSLSISRGVQPNEPRGSSLNITRAGGFYNAFGYNSAFIAVREGRAPTQGSGDRHALLDRQRLILQSRDFARNNSIYKGMLDRAVSYIIGNGFGLQAKTEDEAWNSQAEALWREFWTKPEIRQLDSGRSFEAMVMKELLTCGDTGIIKTGEGLLQHIEAEQIVGPHLLGIGIDVDRVGRPTKFMVCPYGAAGAPLLNQKQDVSIEDILFVVHRERPTSTRGVPPCQAAFPMLHRINDVFDAEAIAWQMLARMAISINRKDASLVSQAISTPDNSLLTGSRPGDATTNITELDYAIIFHGEPGEEVKGIERNIPAQNFPEAITMFMRAMGTALGMPVEISLLDWTKSNYSQSRAVLQQAYTTFEQWQYLVENGFHQPTYRWFIDRMVTAGRLAARQDQFAHGWIKPTFPWLDLLKETEAQGVKLDRGLETHSNVLKSEGLDRDDVLQQRESEIMGAIEISDRIKEKTGRDVPWQVFAGLAMVAPTKPNPAADVQQEEKDAGAKAPVQPIQIINHLPPSSVNAQIEVKPTPIEVKNQIDVKVEPTPIEMKNQVDVKVEPTPIQVKNENKIELPPTRQTLTIVEDEKGNVAGAEIISEVVPPNAKATGPSGQTLEGEGKQA